MSHTMTAMFNQRSDAEAAKGKLKASPIDANHIQLHDKSSAGFSDTSYSTNENPGIWARIKNAFMPDEDRHVYEEGVRRDSTLLTVDVDAGQTDEALRVLDQCNGVDIEDRSKQWRASGWDHSTGTVGTGSVGVAAADTAIHGKTRAGANRDEVIPIVEEELMVGKREVDRGGARVRAFVSNVPIHEKIRLRNERVEVARRRVDKPLSDADGYAFRERTVDMMTTGEEAVIGKKAHVVEEVVVSEISEKRVQGIDETVRRTKVEVDNDAESGVGTRTDRDLRH